MFLTHEVVNQAIDLTVASIQHASNNGLVDGEHCYIVVYGPNTGTGQVNYIAARALGSQAEWKHDYAEIALQKAQLSRIHKMDTRDILLNHPHLLQRDDIRFYGSVWREGLVAAVSGFSQEQDHAFAACIAEHCIAICRQLAKEFQQQHADDTLNYFRN